ncbi:uncharacterized protein LOC142591084 isoform X2 [Dermacentor variabilis]|uniref:uncharacterized protein LOC142591084 isoform X2 n=1 Tax=Dermacentor variabilis TaxID=34621 RepID=UPI003F5C2C4E
MYLYLHMSPANSSETLYLVGYSSELNNSNINCVKSEYRDPRSSNVRRILSMTVYNTTTGQSDLTAFVTFIDIPESPIISSINITEHTGRTLPKKAIGEAGEGVTMKTVSQVTVGNITTWEFRAAVRVPFMNMSFARGASPWQTGRLVNLTGVLTSYKVIYYNNDTMILGNQFANLKEKAVCSLWTNLNYYKAKESQLPQSTLLYWQSNCNNTNLVPYSNDCFA